MKAAIFGVRDAEYVKKEIESDANSNLDIVYFVDNNKKLWGTFFPLGDNTKIKIISFQELEKKYKSGAIEVVLVAVRNGYNRWFITNQLQKAGIDKIGLVKPSVITYQWSMKFYNNNQRKCCSNQIVWVDEIQKPIIHYLEIHAMDSCNLNCKGCLHFSNLYYHDEKPDLNRLIKDVQQLSDNCYILHLRVLGGEPLLNPNLDILLEGLRGVLPDTDIGVVTNGTLIPKQDKKLFQIMKRNEIGFNITLYPPTHKMKDEIYTILNENKVSYGSHLAKVNKISKNLMIEPNLGVITSHTKCVSKNCFFLREGKLYKCAPAALINRFYETYGLPVRMNAGINIYDSEIKWEQELSGMYEKPTELCKYCSDSLVNYSWAVANPPKMEDWII